MPSADPSPRPEKLRVLVVDDEKNIRTTLSLCLEQLGCHVTAVSSLQGALEAIAKHPYELAFLDIRLGEASGLDLIPKLLMDRPNLLIVVITAYATIDSAVAAMKRGAVDYLPKPFQPAQIRHVIDQCMQARDLRRQLTDLESRLQRSGTRSGIGERLGEGARGARNRKARRTFGRCGSVARRKRHGKDRTRTDDPFAQPA